MSSISKNQGSGSVSRHESLQKKRISWGPSKILEFFPAEKFNVPSNDSSLEVIETPHL
jgi:hypothetical protein